MNSVKIISALFRDFYGQTFIGVLNNFLTFERIILEFRIICSEANEPLNRPMTVRLSATLKKLDMTFSKFKHQQTLKEADDC